MAFRPESLGSFAGKSVLVTGANAGIGWQTAAEFARHGAAVTLACRNLERADRAADRIRALVPGSDVRVSELNLAALSSVRKFADGWTGSLHVLINNAGVMAPPSWRATEDDFELQFGTNHLGHYALTGLLLPHLLTAAPARVVTVSSLAHGGGDASVLLGNPAEGYRPRKAYSNSKLANLLFGLELQRRAEAAPSALTSTVAHPGIAATNLFRSKDGLGANPVIRGFGTVFGRVIFQSARAGALPTLYAATEAAPGSYSGPQWPGEIRGSVGPAAISPTGLDTGLAAQLWDLSAELTEVEYEFGLQ
jgi:NAD(P)-dependent dehydrogenase (short-subunit alcohol dehydrogenase family)